MATSGITCDVPRRQLLDDCVAGLAWEVRSAPTLEKATMTPMHRSAKNRAAIGERRRRKVERQFPDDHSAAAYLDALEEIEVE